jgi:predicted AAA+ superfamily ATPase
MLLNFHALSQELRRDRRTLENYFFYLRYALCCQILWRYEKTLATSYKKLKKVYLSNPAFTLALNPSIDQNLLLEQLFVNWFSAKFFYRSKTEIDLVLTNGHVLPIEIKIAERIKKTYLRSMFNFLEKNAACFGLIITDKEDTEFRRGDFLVRLLPYWKVFSLLRVTKVAPA